MEREKYRKLTFQERVIIETLRNQNKKKAYIAKQLNRHPSTITRELKLWGNIPGSYDAKIAHWWAKQFASWLRLSPNNKISGG